MKNSTVENRTTAREVIEHAESAVKFKRNLEHIFANEVKVRFHPAENEFKFYIQTHGGNWIQVDRALAERHVGNLIGNPIP